MLPMAYAVNVTRDGEWWMMAVPAIDGLTQARRLSDASGWPPNWWPWKQAPILRMWQSPCASRLRPPNRPNFHRRIKTSC